VRKKMQQKQRPKEEGGMAWERAVAETRRLGEEKVKLLMMQELPGRSTDALDPRAR